MEPKLEENPMVNMIIIFVLTLSQYSLCEPSSTAQICHSLRDYFSMHNLICHATFTLFTVSNNKIIFHWIRTVVTAWKSPAGWWETEPLLIFLKITTGRWAYRATGVILWFDKMNR